MKKFTFLMVLLIYILAGQDINAQNPNKKFKMEAGKSETINLNKTYTSSQEIFPFEGVKNKIYGLAVSAEIKLQDEESLVRLVLVDENYEDHLIYESYVLLDGVNTFSIDEICEETALLYGIRIRSVNLEINRAEITLNTLTLSTQIEPGIKTDQVKKEKKQQQNEDKINRLNKNLKTKGKKWVAGPTQVSELSYSDRKKLYGESTFPAGFEYYAGGIISTEPTDSEGSYLKSATASLYVDDWDWRNRHGKNWVTPVVNQGSCGSCWSFAAAGAIESLVNLYFNQQLNLDLSEQDLLSCSGAGSCSGGYPYKALDYIKNRGIIDEATFPYIGNNGTCTSMGTNPSEIIKIGGRYDFGSSLFPKTEDVLKDMLIKMGPLSGGLSDWAHAMTLVGYQIVKEGDVFYYRDLSLKRYWVTIEAGNALIGKTVWIFKNSWGDRFGDAGYIYVETPITNINWTHGIKGPITSHVKNYNVICEDNDGDGYFWWGLGPKPATCNCPDEPDGDDSDPTRGPLDAYGNYRILNGSPSAGFTAATTVVTEGESVQFTDLSSNNPQSWWWVFEGGTPASSTLKNPAVNYKVPGNYKVALTAANVNGSDTKTIENFISVEPVEIYVDDNPVVPPVADFSASTSVVQTGESIRFTDKSLNEPTGWYWEFPGGVPGTSKEQNPAVTYNTSGKFDVTLVVSKEGLEPSRLVKTSFVSVTEIQPATYCLPLAVNSTSDYISGIVIGGVLNSSPAAGGYSLAAGTVSMIGGRRYNISLTPKNFARRNYWKIWIDVNSDGDFNDGDETLLTINNKKGQVNSAITIPQSATGECRMRIAMRHLTAPSPCDDGYEGDVQDYSVAFEAAPQESEVLTSLDAISGGTSGIQLYPNPVTGNLTIKVNAIAPGDNYSIYSINGEKMSSGILVETSTLVDLSSKVPGVYFVVITNDSMICREKIVVK